MIEQLAAHARYRALAVPWLARVPDHWEVRRTKTLLWELDRRTLTGKERLLSLRMHAGLVDHHALGGKHIPPSALIGYKRVLPGEIVMNRMRAALGLFAAATSEGLVSPDYAIFRVSPELNASYAVHLFRTPVMTSVFRIDSRGLGTGEAGFLRLYSDRFGMLPMPLPPLEEQEAIVRFLDHANRRIERFIRAKRKLIALLNEQKQAIIHRAVTRGLDPNVPMKDSGVPWLGEIPAHWEPMQLRRLLSYVTSGSRGWASYYSEDGLIFLQSGNLGRALSLNLSRVQHVQPPNGAEGERTKVGVGDILVCITGALTGNVVVVDRELDRAAFVNQHVALCRPRTEVTNPRFLAYSMHSDIGRVQFKASEYGGTKQGLSLGDVKAVWVTKPPIAEARSIVEMLDARTVEYGVAIGKAESEIALMREYRTRLVADIVTGQLDVREAASRVPVEELEIDDASTALDEDDELALDDADSSSDEDAA